MTSEFAIAIHALVFLNHRACTLSSEVLASNVCTNPARIRKVMGKLKKVGIVATKEGLEGGYSIIKDASDISLKDVGEALHVNYVSASWKSGNQDKPCLIASGMGNLMDGIYDELNNVCKNRLEDITIEEIERQIFVNKKI